MNQGVLDIPPPVISFRPDAATGSIGVDLRRLIANRMLVSASSGAGKSYLLRYLCEETCDLVPQLLFDWEGEFSSLREIHPYVIIGRLADGADLDISVSTARLHARRLLPSGASVIVDLSDLDIDERQEYVHLFLAELMALGRDQWHRRLVIIDEAHEFCPQGGQVASSKSVKALVARGRKRGYGVVLATQRLAKLHKDAAEVGCRFIGRTVLDVDLHRVAEELGFDRRQALDVKRLKRGQFWAFGPAIQNGELVVLVRSGQVRTHHPDGTTATTVPPTPSEIAAALADLRDADVLTDEDAREEELLEEIERLREQLKSAEAGNVSDPADIRRAVNAATAPLLEQIKASELRHAQIIHAIQGALLAAGEIPTCERQTEGTPIVCVGVEPDADDAERRSETDLGQVSDGRPERPDRSAGTAEKPFPDEIEARMADALVERGEMSKDELAEITDQSPHSSTFRAHCKRLKDFGVACYPGPGRIAPTEDALRESSQQPDNLPLVEYASQDELQRLYDSNCCDKLTCNKGKVIMWRGRQVVIIGASCSGKGISYVKGFNVCARKEWKEATLEYAELIKRSAPASYLGQEFSSLGNSWVICGPEFLVEPEERHGR